MLYLTELSVPVSAVRRDALESDPLVAADLSYALKVWLSRHQSVAVRPWRACNAGRSVRIVGWRSEVPDLKAVSGNTYIGYRPFHLCAGKAVTLEGNFVPIRRVTRGGSVRLSRDAAEGRDNELDAYKIWLSERLIDVMPFFDVAHCNIRTIAKRRVLRKFGNHSRSKVKEEVIPVVTAELSGIVREETGFENWLSKGVGPQKAFGFGAFLPC
jgi:hypothetical protein